MVKDSMMGELAVVNTGGGSHIGPANPTVVLALVSSVQGTEASFDRFAEGQQIEGFPHLWGQNIP